jgi:DNA-binding GntR family transcriptional regulator
MNIDDTVGAELGQALEGFSPTTIKDALVRELRSAIITGQLAPGQRLVEHKLAPLFRVSRTPLREALRELEKERFVEKLPQGGVRVSPLSVEEMLNLNEVRRVLEVLAVQATANNVRLGRLNPDEEDRLKGLSRLTQNMHHSLASGDLIQLLELGKAFHQAIYALARNPVAEEILLRVINSMERYRALVPASRNEAAVEEHSAIADAVMAGDADLAGKLMDRHISAAGDHYRETIKQKSEGGA